MYKALESINNTDIVIIDSYWQCRLDELREKSRSNQLLCQGCGQSVIVKAGDTRRHHFAHKIATNCKYTEASIELLKAREILYEWLSVKFPSLVIIEKKLGKLYRPIDCWVNREKERRKSIVYWIVDKGLSPTKRKAIKSELEELGIDVNWIFLSEMMVQSKNGSSFPILSTTERFFLRHSNYGLNEKHHVFGGNTLHYLDTNKGTLTTYRCLTLTHSPNEFSGSSIETSLSDLLINPRNGEFVHPGEYDALMDAKNRGMQPPALLSGTMMQGKESMAIAPMNVYSIIAKCIFCGENTSDWWFHDGATKECKCNKCLVQGRHRI